MSSINKLHNKIKIIISKEKKKLLTNRKIQLLQVKNVIWNFKKIINIIEINNYN